MFFAKVSRRWFFIGFAAGLVFVLVAEWMGVLVLAHYHKKKPGELAQQLAKPPIPSTIDADFSLVLRTLDEKPFDFGVLKGKPIFLAFWNPDCVTCQAELPSMERLYRKVGEKVAFVLAAVSGSRQEVLDVATEYQLTVPLYWVQGERGEVFKTPSVPAAFIITPEGKIAFRHEGPARWDDDSTAKFLVGLAAPPSP